MIPIGDELPTVRVPWMTYLILGVTFAVWILVQGAGLDEVALATSVCNLGLVPGEITRLAPVGLGVPLGDGMACVVDREWVNWLTPIFSVFLHGSWGHILGNALFLAIFGNNIEDSMGPGRFLGFYLISGLAAAAAQVLVTPASPVPTVGASGAISGIMGAYVVLYTNVRVRVYFPPFFLFRVRAWIVLLYWFALQLLMGVTQLSDIRADVSGGVAVWAHVGGFVAGLLLVKLFERRNLVVRRAEMR